MIIPKLNDLKCLSTWPEGSVGEKQQMELISDLLELCKEHGFGNVPQVAAWIEDIWRNPEELQKYQKGKQKHLDFMAGYQNVIGYNK